jgi:uncharacterized membrane protein YgcG
MAAATTITTQERRVAGSSVAVVGRGAVAMAAAAAQPPAIASVLRVLQAARGAAARCPTSVWPLLDHDGATRGYGERLMAPLSRAEAIEADRAVAAVAAALSGGGGKDDDDAARRALPKPTQYLRAAVAVLLNALEAPAPEEEEQQQKKKSDKAASPAAPAACARALHAADALSFARGLAAYATPWARDAGERLALGLARWCPDAREELLSIGGNGASGGGSGGGGGSSAPGDARAGAAAIVGGALVSRAPFGSELFRRSVVAACMSLDGCTGDDFARFCGAGPYAGRGGGAAPIGGASTWAPCPLARLHARLGEEAVEGGDAGAKEERAACRDAFLLCLGRARRAAMAAGLRGPGSLAAPPAAAGGGAPLPLPSDGCWASVSGLERLEDKLAGPKEKAKKQEEEAKAAVVASLRPPPPPSSSSSSSAVIEAARRAWAARPLRDPLPHEAILVQKSTSQAPNPKAPLKARPRLSWRQTSADVDVRLALPLGTTARDVRVDVTPTRLRVRLSWLLNEEDAPPVLEGEFYRRVKAGEAVWTVASCGGGGAGGPAGGPDDDGSEAAELQLLLPKDEARRYWKGLFAGEEERGHLQLLREAVDAEETRADAAALDAAAMGSGGGGGGGGGEEGEEGGDGKSGGGGAAELLRQLRERQELVASGALDLEHGFDDFRLVLSDEGL